jgi:predicted dehydrogenase
VNGEWGLVIGESLITIHQFLSLSKTKMSPINFAIIGGGWRTRFFLKIAQELPERFRVTGMMVRDAAKARTIQDEWHVPTQQKLDEFFAQNKAAQFVITSVPWAVNPDLMTACIAHGLPVLSETPPAPTIEALVALWQALGPHAKVQIAEQYPFQPLHAARLNVIASGKLGSVSQAHVSIAHGYHGIVLMRRFLGIGPESEFERATISAREFTSKLVQGPGRAGPPTEEKIVDDTQLLAHFAFEGGKLGVFEFTGAQYFSHVRGNRLLVRGERGEIEGDTVRYLKDFRTPIWQTLQRHDTGYSGNLEGWHHRGYLLGEQWVYQNPFAPARLSDDEIAVATCLQKMGDYVNGGPSFYSLAEASQDHYLNLLMAQAATTGETIQSQDQVWAQ